MDPTVFSFVFYPYINYIRIQLNLESPSAIFPFEVMLESRYSDYTVSNVDLLKYESKLVHTLKQPHNPDSSPNIPKLL